MYQVIEEQDIAQKLDFLTKLISEVKLNNEVLTEKVSCMDSRIGQSEELCRNTSPPHGKNAHMSEWDRSWHTGMMDDYSVWSTHQEPNRGDVQGTDRTPMDNVDELGPQRSFSACVGYLHTNVRLHLHYMGACGLLLAILFTQLSHEEVVIYKYDIPVGWPTWLWYPRSNIPSDNIPPLVKHSQTTSITV